MCKECIRSRYGIHVFLRNAASPPVKYRGVTAQRFGRVRRLGLRSDPARGRAVLPARLGARPDRGGVEALRSPRSLYWKRSLEVRAQRSESRMYLVKFLKGMPI